MTKPEEYLGFVTKLIAKYDKTKICDSNVLCKVSAMTTMKEIASKTGVSVSTVSLVLNNRDEGRVKPHIAQLVRDTAADLGYEPNVLARSLRTNKSHMLGFISVEVATTPYAGGIIQGAQDAAGELGYMLLTVSGDNHDAIEAEIAALKRYGVDGFCYSTMSNRIAHIPPSLTQYPLVLVDAAGDNSTYPAIEPNEELIGYDATTRLLEASCKRIAYVGCSEIMLAQEGRLAGYKRALDEHGIAFNASLVCNVLNNEPALDSVDALFTREKPDGFFCFNDARAWYVYECAARRGLIVGRDISIVGVDNHRVFAETLAPQLTTIELPHYEMGYWGVNKLVSMIESRPIDESSWPHTTAPMPSLDSDNPVKIHCTLLEKGSVQNSQDKGQAQRITNL